LNHLKVVEVVVKGGFQMEEESLTEDQTVEEMVKVSRKI
jgi:hypothetical protein